MRDKQEPIAIIGTGCRFPGGCNSSSKLWELLRNPRDLRKVIPEDRFSVEGFYHPKNSHHGTSNVQHSYLLDEDLRHFDAEFFGIKAIEANSIDPQQRLLLETVYESLEDAGLSMKQLRGSNTAVYVGVMSADFTDMIGRDVEMFPTYFATGTARSILSNRLSYFFDWHGPSMTIDTACSSSLIAMHHAVQTLRAGESSIAVVAGSNVILGPEQFIAESKLQMLSPTGRSRMWDAGADGYARGEGVAAIILKPLSKAFADGDHVECVIRETGVNQDGKTPGITMPSAAAQAALIKATYSKAGLDINKPSDRPQFFEAHGTGTPAGDPIEAKAIFDAFFGGRPFAAPRDSKEILYVGSIKTVIGHTEGTAGLAGVIKASLALKSGEIPPNRLFNKLNPKIEPFYGPMKIVSAVQKWPELPNHGLRRVSVNSFGFGGTNCHAILESADGHRSATSNELVNHDSGNWYGFSPFVFSAATDNALASTLESFRDYLATPRGSVINLKNLSWTLNERRTTLACRAAVPAAKTTQDLINNLTESIQLLSESEEQHAANSRKSGTLSRVLGVFTGQGAQWARMGAALIENSPSVNRILSHLDQSLQTLPHEDRPAWSLRDQLLAPAESSEVGTASLSQPLCTAIQIILVDLLRAAGIQFSAVVGHSSGEIAAAYASGYLLAEDAIRIAYYRGLHLRSVTQQGAMLAVGTSYDDAKELCSLPAFEGRICVAASNSPASVALSGDADAIDEVKELLDEEKKFTRLLKVDRAYHSHHMQVCAESYIRSLERCGISPIPQNTTADCRWVSSVFCCDVSQLPNLRELGASYWVSNLTKPVLFAEALQLLNQNRSSEKTWYDLAIEVGPHPALKGPVNQTFQEGMIDKPIPYTGAMIRGANSVEAFSICLGFVWKTFGDGVVDLTAYDRFMTGTSAAEYENIHIKGLPTYPWDHKRAFWHESRLSRAFRMRMDKPHELLGRQILHGTPSEMRWRNIIKRGEIDWLDGHQVQGQTVFPCAGYVSVCLEACMRAFGSSGPVQSIELRNFDVGHAMVFGDDDSGVDSLVILHDITRMKSDARHEINAHFSFHSAPDNDTLDMSLHASCQVLVVLGDSDPCLLPSKVPDYDDYALLDVEEDRFYNALGDIGFGYFGPFYALRKLKRKLGSAQGVIQNPACATTGHAESLLIHPATLDAAIQSIMLAFCYPGDSMLRSIYLPTKIERLIVNPLHCLTFAGKDIEVPFDSAASISTAKSLSGDASIYSPRGFSFKAIQLEGLQTRPMSGLSKTSDLDIFTELVWDIDRPDSEVVMARTPVAELDEELLVSLERVAYFYLRTLNDSFPPSQRVDMDWHFKRLFTLIDHTLPRVAKGMNPFARKEWIHDTRDCITELLDRYPDNADLRLLHAVGESLGDVIRGETTMLEHMIRDNKLNDFYVYAEGMPRYTAYLAAFASQIGHRYPHMHVLEIGAGTGGATKSFLRELGDQFATYTFTDISSGFFEKASNVFSSYSSKMNFKVLDIEKDIENQGFTPGSFDVIIASLVLHATRNLKQTLSNVRNLLKPGGYLLLLEITENEQMRFGLIFGGLPGWWLGCEDGRVLSPCVGLDEWDRLLRQTGFSGIDTVVPHEQKLPVPLSVIVSQAVDEKVDFLRFPLLRSDSTSIQRLSIISDGGNSSALASEIQGILSPRCGTINLISSLQSVQETNLAVGGSVLCLSDLDSPVFKSIDPSKLRGFQEIFKQSTNVLWVTRGARNGDPYARMVLGFGRTIVLEMLHLRLQFLDLDSAATPDPVVIAESLLSLEASRAWDEINDGDLSLLHSLEPELYLDAAGKFHVPRFKLNQNQNNRYKSAKRTITEQADIAQATVKLICKDSTYTLIKTDLSHTTHSWPTHEQIVEMDVLYSVNQSVRVAENCFLFPIVGRAVCTGERVLALSTTLASKVVVPKSFVLSGFNMDGNEDNLLQLFYLELLGRAALANLSAGTQIIVSRPDKTFLRTLDRLATDSWASILYLTNQSNEKCEYVHPMTGKLALRNLLVPRATTAANYILVDMNGDDHITSTVAECLRPCKIETLRKSDVTDILGRLPDYDFRQNVRTALTNAKHGLQHQEPFLETAEPNFSNFPLEQLISDDSKRSENDFVISWPLGPNIVPISVETIDKNVRFRSDKTYWLVGLTGGLGLSLCAWMVRQGARFVVITSRNPRVDKGFFRKMKSWGATVQIIPANVCDRNSVHSAYSEIVQTLPSIAGVAQGAMILHDTMFTDLDMERIDKVMRPKVQGSIYLEELFHNTDLEFFVFFSSMACVTGNPGQSAYAAANMFMSGLAVSRRQRGLNASAVHIGAIFGNGYVTRELTLSQQLFLRKVGNLWLSEQDFHTLFAEAVYAGQAHRGKNPELSTGLMMIEDNEEFRRNITWFKNPMFQHCVRNAHGAELMGTTGKDDRQIPVKSQLQEAFTPDDVRDIIYAAFSLKLQASLQVEEGRPISELTADDLGIDSLVAVDIRSWFIKEFQVEIPVLKILSGAKVNEILGQVQQLLPKELTPNLDLSAKRSSKQKPPTKILTSITKTVAPLPNRTQISPPRAADNTTAMKQTRLPFSESMTGATITPPSDLEREAQPASSALFPTLNHSSGKFSPVKTSSSITSASYPNIFVANSTDSKITSSSISSPETDGTELSSRSSDVATKPPGVGITACLEKHKILDNTIQNVVKTVPISFAQSRFWFLEQFLSDPSSALNITVSIDLQGSLHIEQLSKAVSLVGQRHEALRTRFSASEASENVVQEILATSCLCLESHDIDQDSQADEWHRGLMRHRYKLSKGELMRIVLLKRSPTSFRLVIGYHHINMDGISLEVILRELQLIYHFQSPSPVREILQYPDFTDQQHKQYKSGQWADDISYWINEFGGQALPVLPILPLSKNRVRLPLTSYASNTADLYLDQSILATIKTMCSRLKVSLFHFHLAVFYTLLTRLVAVEKLCIGISSANRHEPPTMDSVGMYLNLLGLLFKAQPNQTFANAMKLMRDKSLAAFGHSAVPIDIIMNELGVSRTGFHNPLFQVLVNYRPGVSERREFCDCHSQVTTFEQGQTACDLTLDIVENPGSDCRVILGGQSTLYQENDLGKLRDMYLELVKSFSRNPALRLNAVSLYNPEDVAAAVRIGRGPIHKNSWTETLIHRIDEIVERFANKVALQDGTERSLTYLQMARKVQCLCVTLAKDTEQPLGPRSKICVFLNPCMDWVCSLLAILRLGATYVPLDPAAGKDRLLSIVHDCKPNLLIISNDTMAESTIFESAMERKHVFNVDTFTESPLGETVTIGAKAKSSAALVYTSGSTGVPKGIVIKHESFRNHIEAMTKILSYREGQDIMLQQSSYNFDMSLAQIFLSLCNGGTLHIVPKRSRGDPLAISSIIVKEKITITIATPSELISWIDYGDPTALSKSTWRVTQSGGEPVRDSLLKRFRDLQKPDLQLIDCYGPTEITFCSNFRVVDYRHDILSPLATSDQNGMEVLPNYSVYILDTNQKPVPAGISGEIAIGGAGVAAGYLCSEMNARGFKRDIWAPAEFVENGWTTLHHTGDMGRLSPSDGSLILGSRIEGDTQVKLRGMRIDLQEIESAIFKSAEGKISDVCVTLRGSKKPGEEYLIAIVSSVIPQSPSSLNKILEQLTLPQYMRPAAIVSLEKIPTTSSGKIDRLLLRSLPLSVEQDKPSPEYEFNKSFNANESRLLHLWEGILEKEVLSQYQMSRNSDFFHVGGNSMLLVKLRSEIQRAFNFEISLFQLFESSTLGGMATLLPTNYPGTAPTTSNGSITTEPGIDWESETAVSPSLLRVRVDRRFFGNPSVVVLTGSTGFLGQAILRRLLEDSIVQKIHCLAVRKEVSELCKELFRSPKVIIHRGDLALPHFGLSEKTLSDIFSEAHAVIHNGADVSFMKSYESLKPANLDATKQLVHLSLPYHLSFHYVSTSSVAQLTGQEVWGQRSVKDYPPPSTKGAGYIATKWATERYLEKISDQCALPIWVHRPSSITGAGASKVDLMANLLHFAKEMKAIPTTSAWKGWLDFVSVGLVAMQIADEVYEDYSWPGNVKYLYESGEEVVPLSDLRGMLERETGSTVEELPMDAWVRRAEERGMSPLLGEYLRGVAGINLVFPLLEKEVSWS